MATMIANPFRYGQIVREADFCPRPALEKRLRSCFASGQNAVLFGERRVGKSSLIFRAAAKTRGKELLHVDLLGIKSVEDFLNRAVHALESLARNERFLKRLMKAVSRLGVSISFHPATGDPVFSPTFTPAPVQAGSLRQLGELWSELNESQRLIIALDEFQDILALDDSEAALAILRGEIQQLDAIPVCFAGSVRNEMLSIFTSEKSPFFKSAVSLEWVESRFTRRSSCRPPASRRRVRRRRP